jgi:DNA-binding transcriptional ArsR family regulator
MRILTVLNQRVASPKELARELDESLGNVSYHTRKLLELDCVELVREEKRRGALEHYYRAMERPILSSDDLDKIPLSVRRGIADGILTQIGKDLRGAAEQGGFDRTDVYLSRTPLALDDEGWEALGERLAELHEEALTLQAQSADRVAKAQGATFTANLTLLMFEQPRSTRRRRAK